MAAVCATTVDRIMASAASIVMPMVERVAKSSVGEGCLLEVHTRR